MHRYKLEVAWHGYTAYQYVHKIFSPENFERDFPSHVEMFKNSAAMRFYDLSYALFKVGPEYTTPVFIAFEIFILVVAFCALVKAIRPNASAPVFVLVALLVITSWARNMNIARYGQPYFLGVYHNVADGFRILAIAMMLKRRPILASLFLAAAFTTHPTMGTMGAIFVLAIGLSDLRNVRKRSYLAGGALFVVIAVLWSVCVVGPTLAGGAGFPADLWIKVTKILSCHYYPYRMGLFTSANRAVLIPFLSLMILCTFYMRSKGEKTRTDRRVVAGMMAMLFLVVLGVFFSANSISPFLIKLSWHKANDLMISVALVYVADGLWREFHPRSLWRAGLAGLILVSPFLMNPGFPLLCSLLLTAPAWLSLTREHWKAPGNRIVALLVLLSGALLAYYGTAGWLGPRPWFDPAYVGGRRFVAVLLVFAVGGISIFRFVQRKIAAPMMQAAAIMVLIVCSVRWTTERVLLPQTAAEYRDFKEVQIWARENTKRKALFMVDPTICYGWRDYSVRSSFGNYREWLFLSVCYKSNQRLFNEGVKRASELGLHLPAYFTSPTSGRMALHWKIKEIFYNKDDAWRLDIARRYGIDYFVLVRKYMVSESDLPTAYKNRRFVVLSATER